MRLFIAVPLLKNIQRTVQSVQNTLQANASAGRFVPTGNHHITVRFLGESDRLSDIASAMHEAVRDARPFLLRLGALGEFLHGGARTSYLRVEGDLNELFRLHRTLEDALTERGFVRGRGKVQPHITLARAVEHPSPLVLDVPNEAFWASSIVLFESRNVQGRMVYTPVHTETF